MKNRQLIDLDPIPGGDMGVKVAVTITRSKMPPWMKRFLGEPVIREGLSRVLDYVLGFFERAPIKKITLT